MPLDNSLATEVLNVSRNLGYVQVIKTFYDVSSYGSIISDDVMLNPTNPETGGFYS